MTDRESLNPLKWLFLALAQQRLGRHEQATEDFDRAEAWLSSHPEEIATLRPLRDEVEAALRNPE